MLGMLQLLTRYHYVDEMVEATRERCPSNDQEQAIVAAPAPVVAPRRHIRRTGPAPQGSPRRRRPWEKIRLSQGAAGHFVAGGRRRTV